MSPADYVKETAFATNHLTSKCSDHFYVCSLIVDQHLTTNFVLT